MTRILEEDYAYATARLRAIEIHLLDMNRLERMLEAPTMADSIKFLTEAGYGDGKPIIEQQWESVLDGELSRIYQFLSGLMPHPEVLNVFRLREDYLNIKRMLKALYQSSPIIAAAGEQGTVPIEDIAKSIHERREGTIPEIMGKAILEAMAEFGKRADPRDIDLVIDRATYKHMAVMAEEIGQPYVLDIVRLMTDMANIKIFVRGKAAGESKEFFTRSLLVGGNIEPSKFRENSEKAVEPMLEIIRHTWFGEAAISGMEGVKAGKGMSWLEKKLDDRLMEYIKKARFVAMGVEPMVGHLFGKETEIRNVRILLTGKVNHIPHQDLRERLRIAYV